MFRSQIQKNLLAQRPKLARQSISLKKSTIVFPIDFGRESTGNTQPSTAKKLVSPFKNGSQTFKKKLERHRYANMLQKNAINPEIMFSSQIFNTQVMQIKRSNSQRLSSPINRHLNSQLPTERIKTTKALTSSRMHETQNLFMNSVDKKQHHYKTSNGHESSAKANQTKNQRYNLHHILTTNKKQDLLTCKSFKKSTHVQFYNKQIAQLINKEPGQSFIREEEDSYDESSFNLILRRIKNQKKTQTPKSSTQTLKIKLKNKQKNTRLNLTPKQINYNILYTDNISIGKVQKSQMPESNQKLNFESALEWSDRRLNMMKTTMLKKSQSNLKKQGVREMTFNKKDSKEQEKIEGWGK